MLRAKCFQFFWSLGAASRDAAAKLSLTVCVAPSNVKGLNTRIHDLVTRTIRSLTARNFAWLATDRLIRMGVAAVVGIWIARYLGPNGFGRLNFSLAAVAMLAPVAGLGFDSILRREFIRAPDRIQTIAASALRLRLLGAAIAFGSAMVVAQLCVVSQEERRLLFILAFSLLQPIPMIADSWLQSRLDSKVSVLVQWIGLGVGTILKLIAMLMHAPLEVFAVILVVEAGVGSLLVTIAARNRGFYYGANDASVGKRLLIEGWPLALSGVSAMIYTRIDVMMLRWMAGDNAAGSYAAAVRLSEFSYVLPLIVAVSVQPALVRALNRGPTAYGNATQHYLDASAFFAYSIAVPLSLFSWPIVTFAFGSSYAGAGPILAVHCWATVFVFLGVARGQLFVNEGYTRYSLISTATGALLNILLNFFLIPRYAGMGAAGATVFCQATAAWLSTFWFASSRKIGFAQAKALLIPFRIFTYFLGR